MRLTVRAHVETERTRDAVFGDMSDVRVGATVPARAVRGAGLSAPDRACLSTARLLGFAEPEVLAGLVGPDFRRWTGRTLSEVADCDPEGLTQWLTDSYAAPHGGESFHELLGRIGRVLDAHDWPAAGATIVVTPLVARAVLVHALGAGPEALLRVDVAPGGTVRISRHRSHWRLTALRPPEHS